MSSIVESREVAPMNPGRRVVAAFVSPVNLFENLKRNRGWWLPFLLLTLACLSFCYAVQKQVGWLPAYEGILSHSPKQQAKFAQMEPAQVANAKAIGARFTAVICWATPFFILAVTAIVAAVLLGTLNFVFGGKALYSEVFAVAMYASLPEFLHTLLATITLFGLDSNSFLVTNPLGSNPGYYLPTDTAAWLVTLASSLDLFSLWTLALLTVGCAIVARINRASAAISVLGWWALVVIFKVGTAALQG